jgi:drug/metabolite transporter (DMT)-like permease
MSRALSYTSLHAAVLLFGLSGLIGKSCHSPALVVTCLRSLIGAAALALFLVARRQVLSGAWRGQRAAMLGGGVLLAVHWWTFFAAIQLGSVALGLLTYAAYPLFVTLLGWLCHGEKPSQRDHIACGMVVAGLLLVVPDWKFLDGSATAMAVGIFSGFLFAVLTLLNRRLTATTPPLVLVTWQTATAGLLLLPLAAAHLPAVPAVEWPWLILLGVVFTGLAHALFTASLCAVPLAVVGVAAALEPVYGIAAAWLLLHEIPAPTMLAGGALIIAASLLPLTAPRPEPAPNRNAIVRK